MQSSNHNIVIFSDDDYQPLETAIAILLNPSLFLAEDHVRVKSLSLLSMAASGRETESMYLRRTIRGVKVCVFSS